jgi:hypothetical protein
MAKGKWQMGWLMKCKGHVRAGSRVPFAIYPLPFTIRASARPLPARFFPASAAEIAVVVTTAPATAAVAAAAT